MACWLCNSIILELEVDEFAGEWAEGNVKAELQWKRPPTDCHTSPAFFVRCMFGNVGVQGLVK